MTKRRTLDEVRQTGLKALTKALGPVDMVRFLQQFESGNGDYTVERHGWLEGQDVHAIADDIQRRRHDDAES